MLRKRAEKCKSSFITLVDKNSVFHLEMTRVKSCIRLSSLRINLGWILYQFADSINYT